MAADAQRESATRIESVGGAPSLGNALGDLWQVESRRLPLAAQRLLVVVFVLVLVGSGSWAVYDKVATKHDSSTPASVLPSSTVALATLNTKPSGDQVLNLINMIGKFPAAKGAVDISAGQDPREFVVDKILKAQNCPGVTYANSFAPWLGRYFALGLVDLGSEASAPVLALQSSDAKAAAATINAMNQCTDTTDFFFVARDGYVIASDSKTHLDAIAAAAKKGTLADDANYRKWTAKVSRQGILTFYASRGGFDALVKAASPADADKAQFIKKAVGDFQGMAGALTVTADGLDLTLALGATGIGPASTPLGGTVTGLPSNTAAVFAVAISPTLAGLLADQFTKGMVEGYRSAAAAHGDPNTTDADAKRFIKKTFELNAPQDVATLVQGSMVVTLGGDVPANLTSVQSPMDLPLGLRMSGHGTAIQNAFKPVLSKSPLTVTVAGEDFLLATTAAYSSQLAAGGSLGADPQFKAAVPTASKAQQILFVRIDSAWRWAIMDMLARMGVPHASDVAANTSALSALGVASWSHDGAVMTEMKLTLK